MLFILRKSQLSLFAMPVHVAGSYRKDGTYVKPHMRTARVAMKPHEQGHLFGAPPGAPAAAKKSPKLDKFLAKHGGEARMRSTLMAMRPEQRAKLIDAMAHIDELEPAHVTERLGMHTADLKSGNPAEAQPALFAPEDMPDHAEIKERGEQLEALRDRVGRFASGLSRARDFGAAGHAGHAVGVDVGQLSEKAMDELAEMVAVRQTPVFVDSGAYSLFRKQQADIAAGKDVEPLDFGQILARYDRLAELIHAKNEVEEKVPAPLVSLPDVIGDQQGSLDLLAEHKSWIQATAGFNVLRMMVPCPKGPKYSLSAYYEAAVKAAGTDNFVVGIPTVANPWSPEEVAAFLRDRKPRAVHFLGSLHDSRLTKWLQAVVDSGESKDIEVTADANPLRSAILPRDGTKLEPGERAQKIKDKLGERSRAQELENVIESYGGQEKVREMLAAADFEQQQRFIGMVSDLSGKPQKDVRAEYGLPDGPVEGDTKIEDGAEYVLRNGRWRRANPDAPAQEQRAASDIPGSERLLLVACGDKKKEGAHPAGEIYTGALGAVLTKWIPKGAQRPDLHIISAKHGLVHGDTVIDSYNQRMTPERARELAGQGVDLSQFKGKQYRDVFIAGGADYREVADSYLKQLKDAGVIAQDATVNATHGGIGEIRGQLGEYLRSIGGEARHLKGVSTRAAVESLDSSVRSAMYETDRNLPYVDQQRTKGRGPTPDDIRNAKIYRPSWGNGGADKSRLIEQLKGKRGAKALIDRMRASNGPDGEMVKDLKKYLTEKDISYGLGWWNVEQIKKVDRLARLGITNDHELRLALAEYLVFRDGVKKADPIKEAERALVGKKVGIDFFPTPKPLAAKMAEMADIKPGMTVLEPSAGNGHLADAARDAGATVDAVEISDTLRNVLSAKGHNVAAHDFDTFEPGKLYDAVIMNPPFSDRKDAAHIMRAFNMLKPGGKLVAIAGEGVFFGSDQKAAAFRDWLDELGADVEKLPENTFKGSDLPAQTGANARLIVIEKPTEVVVAPAPAEKPMKNYGWDSVKLADAYSLEDLEKLRQQVTREHANPKNAEGRALENGQPSIHLYDKAGRQKLDKLAMAVYHKTQATREADSKDGPKPAMPAPTNPDIELAEDREDLTDELVRNPHSEKAKAMLREVALKHQGASTV
ncbi:MAG TPA: methyltransferase domain-containing protein [Paraburkholderia sp.]